MPIDSQSTTADRLDRIEQSIEGLNARIARLAIALGLTLDHPEQIAQVLQHSGHPSYGGDERRSPRTLDASVWTGQERRRNHNLQELRGLLVMRYGVEKNLLDQVGLAATQHILQHVKAQLMREGFKPGADGMKVPERATG